MNPSQDFTSGSIPKKLIKFSIPVLLALIIQNLYGAVDLFVLGRYGGTNGVSGVAVGSQVIESLTYIISSFTMSATILLGQKLGEKRPDEAADVIGTAIILFSMIAVGVTAIMLLLSRAIITAMKTPAESFEQALTYFRICAGGFIPIIAYNAISGIMRGLGDSKSPLIFVIIACIANIFGDLLTVAVLHMGAAGAAIATVFGQLVSVLLSLMIIRKRGLPFAFSKKNVRLNTALLKRMVQIGIPASIQEAMTSLSFLIITSIINKMGVVASAAMGIGDKLIMFMFMVPSSFMSASAAFVAQNVGAGEIGRTKKTLKIAMVISASVGFLMFLISFFFGDALVGLFTKDAEVIAAGFLYMRAYSTDCFLVCFVFCFVGFFNGYGATRFVMLQSLITALVFRTPLTYLFSILPGCNLFRLGLASPISSIVGIVMCLLYYKSGRWNLIQKSGIET